MNTLVSALFFFSICSFVKAQWLESQFPSDIKVALAIDFISENQGISGGWNGHLPEIEGKVFYTNDKGIIWQESIIPDSMRVMVSVQMINENTAYGAGAYNLRLNNEAVKPINIPIDKASNSISEYYKTLGADISTAENYRGYFVESTDKGLSWHPKGNFDASVYYLVELFFLIKIMAL